MRTDSTPAPKPLRHNGGSMEPNITLEGRTTMKELTLAPVIMSRRMGMLPDLFSKGEKKEQAIAEWADTSVEKGIVGLMLTNPAVSTPMGTAALNMYVQRMMEDNFRRLEKGEWTPRFGRNR
jgi:hypothetical protein